jgi:hypothetical protein
MAMPQIKPYEDDCRQLRLDANETAFFTRSLTYVKAQTYDVVYTQFSAFSFFPMTSEAGSAAKSILWRAYDQVGSARIIASYADDLPKVGLKAAENLTPVHSIGASYGWSLQDVRSAMLGNVPLESKLATAAVTAHNQLINDICWKGSAEYGLPGLKSNTDIPTSAVGTAWASATADQIIADVLAMNTEIIQNTKGTSKPTLFALPPAQFAIIQSKPRSTTSDTTVLSFLMATLPGVRFEAIWELEDWSGVNDAIIAMTPTAQNMSMEMPQPFEEMPVERHALRFEVATHSRFAGLLIYYPKTMSIRTGI